MKTSQPQLSDFIPQHGHLISRVATYAERKEIGYQRFVEELAPKIWDMLHRDMNGETVSIRYHRTQYEWGIDAATGNVLLKVNRKEESELVNAFTYQEFVSLLQELAPTFIQRLLKICTKTINDARSVNGSNHKKAVMQNFKQYVSKKEAEERLEKLQTAINNFCELYNYATDVWKTQKEIKALFDLAQPVSTKES